MQKSTNFAINLVKMQFKGGFSLYKIIRKSLKVSEIIHLYFLQEK